mmetsp:Transcript_23929/g.35375  ORF Transcript_23929/g.35375 Transcript_23929/m.35375 type:complete len:177 (+) Transcript_23929:371-901(+)
MGYSRPRTLQIFGSYVVRGILVYCLQLAGVLRVTNSLPPFFLIFFIEPRRLIVFINICSYRGAAAAIVVYDITNQDSFTGAKSWVKELQRRGDPNVVIALAGNKADLESRRKVEFEEANAYAEENGILHLETSAKNANNVKALFVEIAKKLPKNPPQQEREAFPIMPPQQESRNCC